MSHSTHSNKTKLSISSLFKKRSSRKLTDDLDDRASELTLFAPSIAASNDSDKSHHKVRKTTKQRLSSLFKQTSTDEPIIEDIPVKDSIKIDQTMISAPTLQTLPADTLKEVEAFVAATLMTVFEKAEAASIHTLGEPDTEDLIPTRDVGLPDFVGPIAVEVPHQAPAIEVLPLQARDTIIMATHMQVKCTLLTPFAEKDVTLSAHGRMKFVGKTEELFSLHQPLQCTQAATLTHYITQVKVTDADMKEKTLMFAFTTAKGRSRFEEVLQKIQ